MDINEQLASMKGELKIWKDFSEQCNAERVALDQTFVDSLKSLVQSRKDLILKNEENKKLNAEIEVLKKEKEVLQKNLDSKIALEEEK